METIKRNVRDLTRDDRSALERVVGHDLEETQQVVLNVVNLDSSDIPQRSSDNIPAWWNVYEGLSDQEIEALDQAIRQRANLTRVFE